MGTGSRDGNEFRPSLVAFSTGAIVTVMLLAVASPARAAVTIGPTDTAAPPSGLTGCGPNPCTITNTVGTGLTLSSPIDGVIVRWRIQTANATATWRLRTLRQTTPGTPGVFLGGGAGNPEVVSPGGERTFDSALPIASGDLVGLDGPPSATAALAYRSLPDGQNRRFIPPLGEAESRSPNGFGGGFVGLFNADVEPDCDADGLGDETQDPSLLGGDCPLRGRALTLDANKNKVKKGRRVTLTGRLTEVARQGECQGAQTVELERKRPRVTSFTTVAQLQTDAAGAFSTRRKVRKTFEYRAQVAAGGGCAEQISNTERVKVKEKKK
jgi:hypothetical protein